MRTPVIFIVFNRPETTIRVFNEIAKAKPETLIVVADGPRTAYPDDLARCAETRAIIDLVNWPCTVITNYSDVNLGCKQRVSSGLDWAFNLVEEAIILEDDCLPHPDFFVFCEKMLEYYRNDPRVSMVAGTNYMHDMLDIKESYCFSRYFPIWGWATWRRAWRKYDITMPDWPLFKSEGQLRCFYSESYKQKILEAMFDEAFNNRIDTWDIQWLYSCLFSNSLSIVPRKNLISNIGVIGTHTSGNSVSNFFPVFPLGNDFVYQETVSPNTTYDDFIFRTKLKRSFIEKAISFLIAIKKKVSSVW